MVTLVTEQLKYIRIAPAWLSVMDNQEVEMKGYEIVEDSGKEQLLEANCFKETDVAS